MRGHLRVTGGGSPGGERRAYRPLFAPEYGEILTPAS